MTAVRDIAPRVGGVAPACAALGVSRATWYRWRSPVYGPPRLKRSRRQLSDAERRVVLEVLHEERFVDRAPAEIHATLLDEGRCLSSVSTMYRLLRQADEVRERRAHRHRREFARPELLAERPNELWSWDITKLKGPQKWRYYYLYVIIDVFSRYVVGWMVAPRETAALAEKLIDETCKRQRIQRDQLTIHADRGSSMTSKSVAFLLADLGITKTHSRPHVSNDNCYSEANFKTLKYHVGFPGQFGSIEDARAYAGPFFDWYDNEHRHSGLAMLTPADVHFGKSAATIAARNDTLKQAHEAHPERFVRGVPVAASPPSAVWINPPQASTAGAGAPPESVH